jgi:F-type H+-transporting ATPase subunit b
MMNLDWWTIALQTVNFAVLVFVLHRFLYKPVLRMIDARKGEIDRQFSDAKAAEDKAKAHLADVELERAGIVTEREAALKSAAAQAQEAAKARGAKAKREAQALLDEARKTIVAEREHALDEARGAALDLGVEFALRLLSEVPGPFRMEGWIEPFRSESWIERIEEYLNALPSQDLESLIRQLAERNSLTIVTASPLPPETAEEWRKRLRRSLGEGATIAFGVDPKLIAGAELHFPAAVLRFSWQSALAALRSEVDGHADAR